MPEFYEYDQGIAVDPNNRSMVASNASVLVFAPGDASRTPLVLWNLSRTMQLANPIKVSEFGYGPAFSVETYKQVAWEGGGFTGLWTSFRGMEQNAKASAEASQASAQAAGEARVAAEAAAGNAAAGVAGALAGAVAEATAAKTAAQAAAGLVGAPAGAAVLAAIQPGGAAHGALSGTIGAQVDASPKVAGKMEKFSSSAPSTTTQQIFSPVAVRGPLKGTYLGAGSHIGNVRQPVGFGIVYDAAQLNEDGGDKVASVLAVTFIGDFTPELNRPGGAKTWLWGSNDFVMLGPLSGAAPVLGVSNAWARLTEIHVNTPNSTYGNILGLIGESNVGATATGSAITGWLASVKAAGPRNNAGASVANAASLYITSPAAGTATNQYAIYVDGSGKSRFGGSIDMSTDPTNPGLFHTYSGEVRSKYVSIGGNVVTTPGGVGVASTAMLTAKSTADGDVVAHFQGRGGQTGDLLRLGNDTTVRTRFDKNGRLGMSNPNVPADADLANGEQMLYVANTAGNPKLMVKGKDSAGTVFTRAISLVAQSGTTAQRPTAAAAGVGGQFYDSTLTKPIWSDGTAWRDAMGTAV